MLNPIGGQIIDDTLNQVELESPFSSEFNLAQQIQQMFIKMLIS